LAANRTRSADIRRWLTGRIIDLLRRAAVDALGHKSKSVGIDQLLIAGANLPAIINQGANFRFRTSLTANRTLSADIHSMDAGQLGRRVIAGLVEKTIPPRHQPPHNSLCSPLMLLGVRR